MLLLLRFFSSLSIYSATHFAYIIIHLYAYPLPKMTLHIVRESLSTSHTLSSMYIFFALLFSLSLCRFLPVPIRTREKKKYNKPAQCVDKLFYTLEYACVCVCSSSYEYAFFFLYILSIFPFTPFCNRQMKVKKRMH